MSIKSEDYMRIGREIMDQTNREIYSQIKHRPDYLKIFEKIEAETLKHHGRIKNKSFNKIIKVNYKLRFEVFKRDGFRCQYCGRSPKKDESVVLHLDHIHPKSKGGKETKENLITACLECNIGKGNRDL